MSADLVVWLRAQLDEDERAARKAARFRYDDPADSPWERARLLVERGVPGSAYPFQARLTPARVLADVASTRRILDYFAPRAEAFDPDALTLVGLLAERYAGQPGWREEWRESMTDADLHAQCLHPGWEYATTQGPRKAWDAADQPPEGDGWERNADRGDDGWERFAFHEESYWRRVRRPS